MQVTGLTLVFGLSYVLCSAGETLAVKSLNYNVPSIVLPAYTAFMSNQMWILMVPVYLCQRGVETFDKKSYLREYLGLGVLTFIVTIFRNVSLNRMPGSVFALLISTSIVFNMGISRILGRWFNQWHILAAGLCICSAASIGISAFLTTQEAMEGSNYSLGVPTALSAAFFVAVLTLWQEKLQTGWDSVNHRLVEMTLVSSVTAALLTIVYGVFTNEIKTWSPVLGGGGPLIIGISIALPLLKLLVRNSKYSTIHYSSAFFFEFVQASGALFASIANILVFGEPWNSGYIVAFICMAASFAAYSYAKVASRSSKPVIEEASVEPIIIVVSPWK